MRSVSSRKWDALSSSLVNREFFTDCGRFPNGRVKGTGIFNLVWYEAGDDKVDDNEQLDELVWLYLSLCEDEQPTTFVSKDEQPTEFVWLYPSPCWKLSTL